MATAATTHESNGRRADVGWLHPRGGSVATGVPLLELDADLARAIPEELHERVAPQLRVRLETLDGGEWDPARTPIHPHGLGLLVIEGLLVRDLCVESRRCAELLGPGDLLRPSSDPTPGAESVSAELCWQVAGTPARIAVLDGRVSHLLCRFPALVNDLLDRVLARSRALQFQLALTQMHGVDRRLELLLWQLADRWGRVTLDGVVLPLDLTHEMLGKLIGARRPSVTTALGRLAERGTVLRYEDGWLLRRDDD
jgi:CRP-like cAMP-binding protein